MSPAIQHAAPAMVSGNEIPIAPLPANGTLSMLTSAGEVRPLEEMENEIIRFAISHYRGQMSEVARRLKIGRSTLYRKLDEAAADDRRWHGRDQLRRNSRLLVGRSKIDRKPSVDFRTFEPWLAGDRQMKGVRGKSAPSVAKGLLEVSLS